MLVCSSKAELQCIIALNRRKFGSVEIYLGEWMKEAGRSEVMLDLGAAWLWVRGIPFHLRSKELYRNIGDLCGGYIGSDESLAAVRIKVRTTGVIPEEIPICFREEVFPIRILLETPNPLSKSGKNPPSPVCGRQKERWWLSGRRGWGRPLKTFRVPPASVFIR
ncbi:hypothetical protein LINGRAHAP2_LOCUS18013 [Linum grandiflorum]